MQISNKLSENKMIAYLRNKKHLLVVVLILSVILRIGAALYLGNSVEILPGTYDQVSYHQLALRIIGGHGFSFGELWWPITAANAPTAHWSFLYTLYLAAVYLIFGPNPLAARLIQAIVTGILLPLFTYKLGRQVFNEVIALVAAAISAIYLYFVYYAGSLMTESFYIVALLAAFYLAIHLVDVSSGLPLTGKDSVAGAFFASSDQIRYALFLGLVLGCAALLRQLSVLFIPFLFAWVWWAGKAKAKNSLIPSLVISAGIIGLMIMPFTIYNYMRFDRFVLLNTNSGYAFFWGNHPIYGTHFESILPPEMGTYQDLIPDELYGLDEAALDQELLKRGIQFIVDDPGRYILLSISRIPAYFMFWPSGDSGLISNISRVFSFGISLPFMLLGLVLAPFSRYAKEKFSLHTPMALLLAFILIYTLIHLLSWALIRYRLPVDAVLILFEALAFVGIADYFSRRRRSLVMNQ